MSHYINSGTSKEREEDLKHPNHTIILVNLPYSASKNEILNLAEKFGEVSCIYERIHDRGLAFVTYYDLRAAIKAVNEIHGMTIESGGQTREIRSNFANKPPQRSKSEAESFCATVLVKGSVTEEKLRPALEMFGEIRDFRSEGDSQFVIAFFDLRSARSAASAKNLRIGDQNVEISYMIDDPNGPLLYEPTNPPQQKPRKRHSERKSEQRREFNQANGSYPPQQFIYNPAQPIPMQIPVQVPQMMGQPMQVQQQQYMMAYPFQFGQQGPFQFPQQQQPSKQKEFN